MGAEEGASLVAAMNDTFAPRRVLPRTASGAVADRLSPTEFE